LLSPNNRRARLLGVMVVHLSHKCLVVPRWCPSVQANDD
jgi:hypothetical protein